MKKVTTILQLIIGVIVILFAFVLFWQALGAIVPSITSILNLSFPIRLSGLSPWLQLILSVFIMQVVAVYTKKIFDKVNVSN